MAFGPKPHGIFGAADESPERIALGDMRGPRSTSEHRVPDGLLDLFIESVKDYAILILDPSGIVVCSNEGARTLEGYSAEELLGKSFTVLFPHEDLAAGKPARELQLALEVGRFEDEGWRVRKDGTRFYANVITTPIWDDGRRLRGFGKITRDVTARKRSEEHAAAERRKAEEALEVAVRARDDFLSMASHELNTPLTPMKLHLARLLHNLPSPAQTLMHLRSLARQTDRLAHLVAELLDVSRIASGRIELRWESTDLALVVRDVAARFSHDGRAPSPGQIVLNLPSSVVGWWDPVRVDQIVNNLISNALKFGDGKPVEISLRRSGTSARLEVRDRGIGILPEDQKRIFERFERAVSSDHYPGFGLGLWIVREVVEALHGTVEVVSTPGSGTTFTVVLPLAERDGP